MRGAHLNARAEEDGKVREVVALAGDAAARDCGNAASGVPGTRDEGVV